MTPLQTRIKEILARAQAATPGPWVGDEFEMTTPKAPVLIPGNVRLVWAEDYHMSEWDAEFCKHARTDVESLAKALEVAVEGLLSECYCTEYGLCRVCKCYVRIEKIMCGGGE